METVPVHSLSIRASNDHLEVTFRRYPYDNDATIPCRHTDVVSVKPLRIRLTIPPGARISDMRTFEGREIILAYDAPQLVPIDSGE